MDAILRVDNLTKQYADFKLDHVSFSVPKGTIMGLIGENGAGKSTTINAILDLIHKDDGTVTFWGQELSSAKQLKEDIGVVFDGINFYETLTPAKVGKIAGDVLSRFRRHLRVSRPPCRDPLPMRTRAHTICEALPHGVLPLYTSTHTDYFRWPWNNGIWIGCITGCTGRLSG